jgi:hypothetical protein
MEAYMKCFKCGAEVHAKVEEPLAVREPTTAYLKAQKLIWDEAIKEHQKLYRENQRLQCEIENLKKEKENK